MDRYEVLHPVWRDPAGSTYVARSPDGQPVAVRFLPAEPAPDLSRGRLLTAIRHPNLAGVRELVAGPRLAVVSEVVEGVALRRRGPVAPAAAARIGAGIAAGLHALHEAGVVHQHLNPANVVVARSGDVLLTDIALGPLLGASPAGRQRLHAGLGAGLSPEVAAGAAPSVASDLYALGVVLAGLMPGLMRGLLRALLAPDPNSRPASAADVRRWLINSRSAIHVTDDQVVATYQTSTYSEEYSAWSSSS